MFWRYKNSESVFYINIAPIMSILGESVSDITSATYMVKVNRSDDDADAVVTKTLGDGMTAVTSSEQLQIEFAPNDFGAGVMEENTRYQVGLRIVTPSMTDPLEIKLKDSQLVIGSSFFTVW